MNNLRRNGKFIDTKKLYDTQSTHNERIINYTILQK